MSEKECTVFVIVAGGTSDEVDVILASGVGKPIIQRYSSILPSSVKDIVQGKVLKVLDLSNSGVPISCPRASLLSLCRACVDRESSIAALAIGGSFVRLETEKDGQQALAWGASRCTLAIAEYITRLRPIPLSLLVKCDKARQAFSRGSPFECIEWDSNVISITYPMTRSECERICAVQAKEIVQLAREVVRDDTTLCLVAGSTAIPGLLEVLDKKTIILTPDDLAMTLFNVCKLETVY